VIRGGTIGVGGCGPSNQSKKPFPEGDGFLFLPTLYVLTLSSFKLT
jgi:hypothetical protein